MNEDTEKKPVKQRVNKVDYIREYQWQKGQSGNPAGRPKEKTLKEFARQFLANMSEETRLAYLATVDPKTIWEMSEGKPHNVIDLKATHTFSEVLNELENGNRRQNPSAEITGQIVEAEISIQDTKQEAGVNNIQPQQSPAALQPAPVVQKYHPQE